jgi:hypothetical protein
MELGGIFVSDAFERAFSALHGFGYTYFFLLSLEIGSPLSDD